MRKALFTLLAVVCVALPVFAQTDYTPLDMNPFHRGSLFGSNKLSMSHSLGFEAGTSSNGYGYYLSRYTNHIGYKFSSKLDLDIDLNLVNFGSADIGKGISFNSDNKSRIIPEFSLRYKPSDSVSLELGFHQVSRYDRYNRFPWSASYFDKE